MSLYAYFHRSCSTNLSFLKPESHEYDRTKRLAATFHRFTLSNEINIDYFLAHLLPGNYNLQNFKPIFFSYFLHSLSLFLL